MPETDRRRAPRTPPERSRFTADPAAANRLGSALKGWTVYAFRSVSSTMELAHELAVEGAPERTLVFAGKQEQGRGRLGRTWSSPKGGAYFSVILRPTRPVREIPQLALVAGLAAAEAVHELTGLSPSVRWPNDLLLDGRKLAGILAESRNGAVVLGIGINVTPRPGELPETAASLGANLRPGGGAPGAKMRLDAPGVTTTVCLALEGWYDIWTRKGFADIRAALRPRIGLFGHPVHVATGSEYFEGTAQDLDELGRLVVRLDSGLMRAFEMGEVARLR